MRSVKKHYLAILSVELDDLKEDIEHLITELEQSKKQHRCTEHVFLHNLTLFRNELLGVNAFHKILDEIDPADYATLEEMIHEIKTRFKLRVEMYGLAQVINILIERKLNKVARYVGLGQIAAEHE
ncbi:MAG: hypothetical protein U5R06_06955 [candidate division KSB1 bacterium]|nr:hypothetical protein [candidate division KSB1 bacterium]